MVSFTLEELNTILNLLDVATKAGGIQIAVKVIPIVQKMELMAQEIKKDASVEANDDH